MVAKSHHSTPGRDGNTGPFIGLAIAYAHFLDAHLVWRRITEIILEPQKEQKKRAPLDGCRDRQK
jgi:hypothetical protein